MTMLTISLPDDVFAKLQKRAVDSGTTYDQIVAEAVTSMPAPIRPSKELRALAGSWSSGVSDLGIRHDEYLGQLLAKDSPSDGHE